LKNENPPVELLFPYLDPRGSIKLKPELMPVLVVFPLSILAYLSRGKGGKILSICAPNLRLDS